MFSLFTLHSILKWFKISKNSWKCISSYYWGTSGFKAYRWNCSFTRSL